MQAINDLIGTPFVSGGRSIQEGFDCWGLAKEVFHRCGIEVRDYKADALNAALVNEIYTQEKSFWNVIDPSEIERHIPCLVVMKFNEMIYCNHVGVYIGEGRFIHIAEKMRVHVARINDLYWRRKIVGYYVPKGGSGVHD